MLTNKKAILFDLDGTLVDSMWMWKEIDVEFLSRFGLSCPDHLQRTIEGMSFTETAVFFQKYFSLPLTIAEIKCCWVEMAIDQYRHHVPLKIGVLEFLNFSRQQGYLTGIATSNGIDMVNAVIDSLKIRPYFQVIVTGCEVPVGKPAPDIYLEAAKRLSVNPVECLVFEDIPAGIIAGKRAQMNVCAVEDEFSKDLVTEKKQLADYYITDYLELLEIIKRGNKK